MDGVVPPDTSEQRIPCRDKSGLHYAWSDATSHACSTWMEIYRYNSGAPTFVKRIDLGLQIPDYHTFKVVQGDTFCWVEPGYQQSYKREDPLDGRFDVRFPVYAKEMFPINLSAH